MIKTTFICDYCGVEEVERLGGWDRHLIPDQKGIPATIRFCLLTNSGDPIHVHEKCVIAALKVIINDYEKTS